MQSALHSRPVPYRFENLTSFSREEAALWNWLCRTGPDHTEWACWVKDILGHLVERPAGHQLRLVQSHMLDADSAEKNLTFGSKSELLIGRGDDNDVVLPAKAIANRHVRLTLVNNQPHLEDLGGRLGTYFWDKRLVPHELQPLNDGDQFSVFPYRFRVHVDKCWSPETEIGLGECRVQSRSRAEFLAMSPIGWNVFILPVHPSGEHALLDVNSNFAASLREHILGPLGAENAAYRVPSDGTILGFVVFALLERLNRQLKFPVQFSFARCDSKAFSDRTRGLLLSSAVTVGGLVGQFRIFLPLELVSKCMPETATKRETGYTEQLCWLFPISAAFVDLSPDEIGQIGSGDVLITENQWQLLLPNDFNKGWCISHEASNTARFLVDNYFERSVGVEAENDATLAKAKPDIGALPLRLHVIVGHNEFTLAEIQSLGPGTIIELEASKSDPVRLMVNGKVLGEGELVEVDGKLAVKVLGWTAV